MTEPQMLSGEMIFLRYAYPCAEGMVVIGRRRKEHLDELTDAVTNSRQPRRRLLKYYFRDAFNSLRNFAYKSGLPTWAANTVADYWRHHHGHEGDCRVQCVTVIATVKNTAEVISREGENFRVVNLYGLDIKPLDSVLIHRRVVIEKEEI